MKLQIAVDVADTEKVLQIAEEVSDIIDIYEVGTPVIMKEGMVPVRKLKQKYPDLCVLADTKIVDGGALEAADVCEAGADILTVLALSDDATVKDVTETAHRYGRKVMADLICVSEPEQRALELLQLGVDYIGIHTGVDQQKAGRTPLGDLERLSAVIAPECISVAGGISLKSIDSYAAFSPGIIIAGSALYRAENIRSAAEEMKKRI